MNQLDGVNFHEAWPSRVLVRLENAGSRVSTRYIDLIALLKNKRVSGRPKDLEDVRFLGPKAKPPRRRQRHSR